MILGLTGGYCSGKSSAAAFLKAAGWTVVDVDAQGHAALLRSAGAVAGLLGPEVLGPDGLPDRRAIGSRVFGNPALLARYEAIVHPEMNALVDRAIDLAGSRVCVDAALLYRLPVVERCDAIIEVRAPLLARLRRGRTRDGLGFRAMLARMARQRPLRVLGRLYAAKTRVVWNGASPRRFEKDLAAALDRLFADMKPRA